MVWITEIPWLEFRNSHDELRPACKGGEAGTMEYELRRRLFTQRHLKVDEVEDGIWWVYKRFKRAGYGVKGSEERIAQGASFIQSHHFQPVIKNLDDIEKIRMPDVIHDHEATSRAMSMAEEAIGDILPVKAQGPRMHWFNAWDEMVRWTGVTEALVDLLDRPDFIHSIMRRMTDSFVMRMKQFEKLGQLDDANLLLRVGSGAAGFTDELASEREGGLRLMDQWSGATAQSLGDVSPAMHQEFAMQYEAEVMSLAGLNYYGCCENLHDKMHLLAKLPRLRKISMGPSCNTALSNDNSEACYVFSHKPNPAIFVPKNFDIQAAESELRKRLEESKGMSCEVIMKDISTIHGRVDNLIEWTQMAMRVAQEHVCSPKT